MRINYFLLSLFAILALVSCQDTHHNGVEMTASLAFNQQPGCTAKSVASGSEIQGKADLTHQEADISWTSECRIPLPQNVRICVKTSEKITNPASFLSLESGVVNGEFVAMIVSESDINPEFGEYQVSYFCH